MAMHAQFKHWVKTLPINAKSALLAGVVLLFLLGIDLMSWITEFNLLLGWLFMLGFIVSLIIFMVGVTLLIIVP